MTKYRAANEHEYACQYRVEKIENANGGNADHEEQRAFNAHIGERLMQALEDSIAAFLFGSMQTSYFKGWVNAQQR